MTRQHEETEKKRFGWSALTGHTRCRQTLTDLDFLVKEWRHFDIETTFFRDWESIFLFPFFYSLYVCLSFTWDCFCFFIHVKFRNYKWVLIKELTFKMMMENLEFIHSSCGKVFLVAWKYILINYLVTNMNMKVCSHKTKDLKRIQHVGYLI